MWRATQSPTGPASGVLASLVGPEPLHPAWAVAAAFGAALAVPILVVASLATYLIVVASVLALPLLFLTGAVAINVRRLFAVKLPMPAETPVVLPLPIDVEQEPALATIRTIGDSAARAAVTVIGADGECPRGLKMGQVIAIDEGRASAPLCRPAIAAVKSALHVLETFPALSEAEATCDCPIPGRSVRFSIQRGDSVQRALPIAA